MDNSHRVPRGRLASATSRASRPMGRLLSGRRRPARLLRHPRRDTYPIVDNFLGQPPPPPPFPKRRGIVRTCNADSPPRPRLLSSAVSQQCRTIPRVLRNPFILCGRCLYARHGRQACLPLLEPVELEEEKQKDTARVAPAAASHDGTLSLGLVSVRLLSCRLVSRLAALVPRV